ncbi:MAG: class I SAM-dependent methyltransferase [Anaerolineae bacterium]|nr:class I SAM-dependent methyltransferase [Anaerolineae bacterium]
MMKLQTLAKLLMNPNLIGQMLIRQDTVALTRANFLYTASTCGLLKQLADWTSRDALLETLDVARPDLLDALLQVGVAVKELSTSKGQFRASGARARALMAEDGEALIALLQEMMTYHQVVYRDFGQHMALGQSGDYLGQGGLMIAQSSRILEPFMKDFVQARAAHRGPIRMLEIGCGSGVYMRYASEANPQVTGIGIDLQSYVVNSTTAWLKAWGLNGRFVVCQGDIRTAELSGMFDLITLYNNIYYFATEERPALLRALYERLSEKGILAIISMFAGAGPESANFDLILRATAGCFALPRLDEIRDQLRQSGFATVQYQRLFPGQPFYGVVASRA